MQFDMPYHHVLNDHRMAEYLSTACLHHRHKECRLTCKWCPAKCVCACHAEEPGIIQLAQGA